MNDQSGPDHVPVSRFRASDAEKDMPINDISGPLFSVSSPSAALQRSLENRLRDLMDANGSPEYVLTWKEWDMLAGAPICALRASERLSADKDFTGWPAPTATRQGPESAKTKKKRGFNSGNNLIDVATAAGWCSPTARDWKDTPNMSKTGKNPDGSARKRLDQLPRQAALVENTLPNQRFTLPNQLIFGRPQSGSRARTGKPGALNPDLPRWLMGYPPAFCESAVTAMQSFRNSRRSSSKPAKPQ